MQRRSQPQTQAAPHAEGKNSTFRIVPPAPLYTQPSLFGGIASAFELYPTLLDDPVFYLSDEQLGLIAMLQDYLALAGDRSRIDAQFREAIRQALLRMSGELRAIAAQSATQSNQRANAPRMPVGEETDRHVSSKSVR